MFNICVTKREVVIKHSYGIPTMTNVSRKNICANELQAALATVYMEHNFYSAEQHQKNYGYLDLRV